MIAVKVFVINFEVIVRFCKVVAMPLDDKLPAAILPAEAVIFVAIRLVTTLTEPLEYRSLVVILPVELLMFVVFI